jgi:hypothetical protein
MATMPIPSFQRAFMAINRVEALLKKVTRALDRARIPYAVVGGNAVAAWVATIDDAAVRSTKDVDLLLRRESLSGAAKVMDKLGFELVEVLGVSMFVERKDPSPKKGVHIVFAKERVRAHYLHAAPDVASAVKSTAGFMVVDLPELVKMKLLSFRLTDQVHLLDLKSMGLIKPALVRKLPKDLRNRLRSLQPEDTAP